jgi:hypothetical protein
VQWGYINRAGKFDRTSEDSKDNRYRQDLFPRPRHFILPCGVLMFGICWRRGGTIKDYPATGLMTGCNNFL